MATLWIHQTLKIIQEDVGFKDAKVIHYKWLWSTEEVILRRHPVSPRRPSLIYLNYFVLCHFNPLPLKIFLTLHELHFQLTPTIMFLILPGLLYPLSSLNS
jgi:hypothetical protein